MIDLRSDTVTQPTAAMKQAMVDAPLGDDVLGDDPTVQALEARAAALSGMEAALFTPSGTMANQLAIACWTRPGDEVLMETGAHPYNYEAAAAAAISGVQTRLIPGVEGGFLVPETVWSSLRPQDDHFAPATLLCVENTTNRGGGRCYPSEALSALAEGAHERGLRIHMDGARVFNAVVRTGVALDEMVRGYDSLSFCLSKGLGAPVGSLLCGPTAMIQRARRVRKMLGGGMRQSGMLAAAGLYALDHNVARLAQDHERARALAHGLTAAGFTVRAPETNMVYVDGLDDATATQERLDELGVACFATGPTSIRMVVHLGLGDADILNAVAAWRAL